MYHNDLLISWLVLKGSSANSTFNVLDWVLQSTEEIADDLDTSLLNFDELVAAALEKHLIATISDGQRTGNWPWTN